MHYHGMDRSALDAAYNNRAAVPDFARHVQSWQERSAVVRAAHPAHLDLAYGPAPRQRLDFFACGRAGAPTLAYLHGGYWQSNDKESFAFLAEGCLPRGINLAVVEYTLAPAARMDAIVAETRSAVDWLIANLPGLGGDPRRLYVAGHSAGGHLTAIAMADPRVAGGLAISGLYDLEPIRLCYLNELLRLDAAEARRNSPLFHLPATASPLIVTVGLAELPELVRQSRDYYEAWTGNGLPGRWLDLPGHDHFSLLEELAAPGGRMLQALETLIAGQ